MCTVVIMSSNMTPQMPQSRRSFLQVSAAVPAAIVLEALLPGGLTADDAPAASPAPKKYPIGIELYSVRGEVFKDLRNTLRTVAKIGYEAVEFFSPYIGWNFPYAKDVRAQLDDLGLRCFSTHNG